MNLLEGELYVCILSNLDAKADAKPAQLIPLSPANCSTQQRSRREITWRIVDLYFIVVGVGLGCR